jgi:Flp pilus assembly protein TadG
VRASVYLLCLRRACDEGGAAIVEFALSASILLSVVFGVFGLSMALYSYHYVSYAARVGTRYAIVRGSSCPTVLPGCPVFGTGADVQTYLRSIAYPGINPNNLTVTTSWPGGGPACTPSRNPCDNPGDLVQVTVSYQLPLLVPFVPVTTMSMSSTSEMVISQ